MPKHTKDLTAAIAAVQPATNALAELGARCMEQVLDRCGIVCERWILPNGKSAIVYGTPHWRDVFVAVSPSDQWSDTLAALAKFAQREEAAQSASLPTERVLLDGGFTDEQAEAEGCGGDAVLDRCVS